MASIIYIPLFQKCPACKHLCKLSDDDIKSGLNECSNGSCAVNEFYVDQVEIRTQDGRIYKFEAIKQ